MRIVFLCGGASPGENGVGDYSRRLAGEIIRNGHSAAIVALNDTDVSSITEAVQRDYLTEICVLRLPSNLSWSIRLSCLSKFIAKRNPEWISLQFVPFAFHRKGLPFRLGTRLKHLGVNCYWHIMFHELWVGIEAGASLKMRVWGKLQVILLKCMIKALRPRVCHTSISFYQILLKRLGVNAQQLPLFGNIIRTSEVKRNIYKDTFVMVVFGTIHYGAPVQAFLRDIKKCYSKKFSKFKMVFLGKNGPELDQWLQACGAENIKVEVVGKQKDNIISNIFLNANLGIATTPYLLSEKSGSIAAMREHGLSVIVVARRWLPLKKMRRLLKYPAMATSYSPEIGININQFLDTPGSASLKEVCAMFLRDIY